MPQLVEVSIPPDALALGCVFNEHPDARIELERVVPVGDDLLPYFWLSNADADLEQAAATIRDHTDAKSLTKLAEHHNRGLFEVVWRPTVDHAVAALQEDHCGCIEATGTRDGWELHLRFTEHENVVAFHKTLTDAGVPVTLTRLEEASPKPDAAALSPEQQEALRLAAEQGYFAVPRECTISDLAAEAGISNSAFSERLRRGLANLVERDPFIIPVKP